MGKEKITIPVDSEFDFPTKDQDGAPIQNSGEGQNRHRRTFDLKRMFWMIWVISLLMVTLNAAAQARSGEVSILNVVIAVIGPILFGISLGMLFQKDFYWMVIGWVLAMGSYAVFACGLI